jgi:hypothetical protein
MLDLRAEVRQSSGEVKPRNVRGRCQKTTTSGRAVAANIAELPEPSRLSRLYCSGPFAALDQGQESESAGSHSRGGGELGAANALVVSQTMLALSDGQLTIVMTAARGCRWKSAACFWNASRRGCNCSAASPIAILMTQCA